MRSTFAVLMRSPSSRARTRRGDGRVGAGSGMWAPVRIAVAVDSNIHGDVTVERRRRKGCHTRTGQGKSPATCSQEPDLPGFFWLREVDLNHRPSGYEPDELPGCSIPRKTGRARCAYALSSNRDGAWEGRPPGQFVKFFRRSL